MILQSWTLAVLLIVFVLMDHHEATSTLFLQAISSALATIPFSGFPMTMTAGVVATKLAVGSKLLYYLGYFGRSGRKKSSAASAASAVKPSLGGGGGKTSNPPKGGFLPLPYALNAAGGGFMPPQQPFGGGGFQGLAENFFPQEFGGFGGGGSLGGMEPSQIFQALASQGINPLQFVQDMGGLGLNPGQLLQAIGGGGIPAEAGPIWSSGKRGQSFYNNKLGGGLPQDLSNSFPPSEEHNMNDEEPALGQSEEDVESFFTFLRDMDENGCISRLICDIGADPAFLGEFSLNIDNIINSLDVPPESGAHQFVVIMETGRLEGGCSQRFQKCTDEAYEIVKSVAPSVSVPQNLNVD